MQTPELLAADRLERYRQIVPDWPAFMDAVRRPLPLSVWTNTLTTNADAVERKLDEAGVAARPMAWLPRAFKGPPSEAIGTSLPFVAGLFHIQEEVSLLPVVLLAPEPGDRVLDLCSAPGNKTAQMAAAMQNTGTIIANDRDTMRTRATRGVLDRLGVINTTIVTADASNLPDAIGRFDRVLADVPCTCEGTTRKHVDALLQSGRNASLNLHRRQLAILRKGVQLCRPGGLIAYSTCTYAPEENEMVVDALLNEVGDEVKLLPAAVDGFASSPGLTEWDGLTFDASLTRCLRVWPHQNDTGGFFVALLKKQGGDREATQDMKQDTEPGASSGDAATTHVVDRRDYVFDDDERRSWMDFLIHRFAFPDQVFSGMDLHQPNNKYVAAISADHRSIDRPDPVSVGMPLIRVSLRFPKLTTAGARLLGRSASTNVVEADDAQIRAYVAREDFYPTAGQLDGITGTGYVLVRHEGTPLGLGLYLGEVGRIRSMFPKVLSNAVSD